MDVKEQRCTGCTVCCTDIDVKEQRCTGLTEYHDCMDVNSDEVGDDRNITVQSDSY